MSLYSRIMQVFKPGSRSAHRGAVNAPGISLKKPREGNRVIPKLTRLTQYKVDLKMDVRDSAILSAENLINPKRRMLYALYKEVADDAHLSSAVTTRRLNTLRETFVIRDEKSGTIDEDLRDLFKTPWFYDFCRLSLDTIFWGHSLIEFGELDDMNEFKSVYLVPREHVKPETQEILIDPSDQKGIPYMESVEGKWLIEVGGCDDLGLYKKASRYVILKRYSLTDWARRSEKYGMPTMIVRTASRDKEELDAKEAMAANLGSNGYAILDDQDEIDLLESNQAFTWQIFDGLTERMDKYISKLILGQTMTADDGSSLSQAQVHERVMDSYTEADMRWLGFQINMKLLPFLVKHGYPLKGKEFEWYRFTPEYEEELLEKKKQTSASPNR